MKDRLVHNGKNRKEGRTVSIDAYGLEDYWNVLSDMGAGNPLCILLEKDHNWEEIEILYRIIAKLTQRQREILILCVVQGKTHAEDARKLGTTHQAVSDSLKKTSAALRRMYGLNEDCGEGFFLKFL